MSPFYYKTSLIEVLQFNNFGHNLSIFGKIASTTFMKIDQSYNKYILSTRISQCLQPIKKNENNIKYYCIIFTMSLLFLYKQHNNLRSKILFVIVSLIQFTIAFYTFNIVCRSKPSLNANLKNSPTKEFFTIEVLHITCKINEFSADMHYSLLVK